MLSGIYGVCESKGGFAGEGEVEIGRIGNGRGPVMRSDPWEEGSRLEYQRAIQTLKMMISL